ncbi:MAG: Fic family protein [Desulfobacteraceae bacterium]|nr:MAG: Fic family protein [Desulfobacteraceae bacterium]
MSYQIILNLQIPSDLSNLIAEIDEFKGRWESLKNSAPDHLSVLRKVATIASISSSTRIEGARLSDADVENLLKNIGPYSFRNRDEEEVVGYADALNLIFDSYAAIPIAENHMKQLHGILLKYSGKDQRHKGEYKKQPNHVEAFDKDGKSIGVVFETATPFDTPFYMKDLTAWYAREITERTLHPLLIIGGFVVHFLAIHPFQDGNGRMARILTTLMLLQQGYEYVPYCSLESIVEENKEQYYLALRKAQTSFKSDHAGMEEWLRYLLRMLKKQKDILAARLEEQNALVLTRLPDLSAAILQHVSNRTKATLSVLMTLTNANRNTLKKHLQALVKKGLLKKHGVRKGTWYTK